MKASFPFSDLKKGSSAPTQKTHPPAKMSLSKGYSLRLFLWLMAKAVIFSALPFVLLIRGVVYLYNILHFSPWLALIGGMLCSATILMLYFAYIQYSWTQSFSFSLKRKYFIAFVLVMVYCLPAVFYLHPINAKYTSVQDEFTSLHPILRLGVSTLIFLDKDLLITDANRLPEDYKRMGLATKKHSLHYIQSTGYSHAIDLRTNGRSAIRNWLVLKYFEWMGFNTLRHVGTADHLHISICSHDNPRAI
jgi:multisubunit Na+/H+ antiporter MnhB subunit